MKSNDNALTVSRFKGEILMSGMLRANRQRAQYESHSCYGNFADIPDRGLFLLRDIPEPSVNSNLDQQFLDTLNDATAWPLICLINDLDPYIKFAYRMNSYFGTGSGQNTIRFCLECASNQRREWGVSWWMRDANLPFVAICPIHYRPLKFADLRAASINDGSLPHEIGDSAQTLDIEINDRCVRQANAVVMLCHYAPQILARSFTEHIEKGLSNTNATQKDLANAVVNVEEAIQKSENSISVKRTRYSGGKWTMLDITTEMKLKYFITLTSDPKAEICKLVRGASSSPLIPKKVDECAIYSLLQRFNRTNQKSPTTSLVRELCQSLHSSCRSASRYEDPLEVDVLRTELASVLIMNWLCRDFLGDFPAIKGRVNFLEEVKSHDRKKIWYVLYRMIEDFRSYGPHPTRSLRITYPLIYEPVLPELKDSILGLLFRFGQYAVYKLKAPP